MSPARTRELDAAGLCRRCGRSPRDGGRTTCAPCREAVNARARRVHRVRGPRAPKVVDGWCVACAAYRFHRAGCAAP